MTATVKFSRAILRKVDLLRITQWEKCKLREQGRNGRGGGHDTHADGAAITAMIVAPGTSSDRWHSTHSRRGVKKSTY